MVKEFVFRPPAVELTDSLVHFGEVVREHRIEVGAFSVVRFVLALENVRFRSVLRLVESARFPLVTAAVVFEDADDVVRSAKMTNFVVQYSHASGISLIRKA